MAGYGCLMAAMHCIWDMADTIRRAMIAQRLYFKLSGMSDKALAQLDIDRSEITGIAFGIGTKKVTHV